jgi:hypothetical protein
VTAQLSGFSQIRDGPEKAVAQVVAWGAVAAYIKIQSTDNVDPVAVDFALLLQQALMEFIAIAVECRSQLNKYGRISQQDQIRLFQAFVTWTAKIAAEDKFASNELSRKYGMAFPTMF